jgi:hypothetical protein
MALLQAVAAAAELRETVAALDSQVHSDEIASHGLNATLSGKDKEIARLEALRGADEEEDGGAGGAREEAAAEVDELKRKLREKEASKARLMAASRDGSREDSHAQSQIDQLIGMVSTLAARQQPGSVHIASSMATAPPVGVYSRSMGDGVDYSEYEGMKAGETHEIFEATMSDVAVKKREMRNLRPPTVPGAGCCACTQCPSAFIINLLAMRLLELQRPRSSRSPQSPSTPKRHLRRCGK